MVAQDPQDLFWLNGKCVRIISNSKKMTKNLKLISFAIIVSIALSFEGVSFAATSVKPEGVRAVTPEALQVTTSIMPAKAPGALRGGREVVIPNGAQNDTAAAVAVGENSLSESVKSLEYKVNILMYVMAGGFSFLIIIILMLLNRIRRGSETK